MIEMIPARHFGIFRMAFGCRIDRMVCSYARATVDVTEPFFIFWSRTNRRTIVKNGILWHFVDTGDFTPDRQAEDMEAEWLAQNPALASALISKQQQ